MNIEEKAFAPVFALGDVLEIDAPATINRRLTVAEICQFGGGLMVDYVIEAPQVRLHFLTSKNGVVRPLERTLFDSFPYNESLLNVVRDDSAKLNIHDDTNPANIADDIFWRIEEMKESHISSVNIWSNKGDTDAEIEYWDYSRLIEIVGFETEEFIFLEMNKADGWF